MVDWFFHACQLDRFPDHFILAIQAFNEAAEKGTENQNTRNTRGTNHDQATGEPVHTSEFMLL